MKLIISSYDYLGICLSSKYIEYSYNHHFRMSQLHTFRYKSNEFSKPKKYLVLWVLIYGWYMNNLWIYESVLEMSLLDISLYILNQGIRSLPIP